jgi:Bacterial toxin 44
MTNEVAANIHFGYVGLLAGFSKGELLLGANLIQQLMGRGEIIDDPRDTQAIKKGFQLFEASSPQQLTKTDLKLNYYEYLSPGEGDPRGCQPCPTKFSGV